MSDALREAESSIVEVGQRIDAALEAVTDPQEPLQKRLAEIAADAFLNKRDVEENEIRGLAANRFGGNHHTPQQSDCTELWARYLSDLWRDVADTIAQQKKVSPPPRNDFQRAAA